MAADTYTTGGVGLFLMGTGNDIGTWGGFLNTNMIQPTEDGLSGTYSSSATGGTLDLSGSPPPTAPSQVRFSRLFFNGALISNLTVIVPNLSKWWLVENATSNAFAVFFKTTAGTATQIPQGTMKVVRCDGSNGMRRLDANEVGRAEDYFGTTIPAGMLECDGASYLQASYPDLFAVIGTTWGSVDGTHFTVPNLKDTGRFKRSRTGSLAIGTYQANQNVSHTHAGTTDVQNIDHTHNQQGTVASTTEIGSHTHTAQGGANVLSTAGSATSFSSGAGAGILQSGLSTESATHTHNVVLSGTTGAMNSSNPHSHTFTTGSSGGSEARPEAAVVLSCIRY